MTDFFARLMSLPAYGIGAIVVLVLYGLQSEVRFGSRARSSRPSESDRKSTLIVALSSMVPVFGFVFAMKANSPKLSGVLPAWFRHATLPGLPVVGWLGVAFGVLGLALRLWAVLTLRDRYTKTLLIQKEHIIERGGPYRWVRHPGYLGSLLCLNGLGLASGNVVVLFASLAVTLAAYGYRIKAEDAMLVAAFGLPYDNYRKQVPALLPNFHSLEPQDVSRYDG
jgi:protein-S-isoprenylcysteine O-methyltransferase Ste14